MNQNPGLLPYKIGSAKVKSKSHTFIHYLDLQPIHEEIYTLKTEYQNITDSTKNHPFSELGNFDRALKYKLLSVEQKFNSINPTSRVKRGLIDGLGSIIKTISGNLDANDGAHYDQAISDLENTQKTIVQKLNREISLTTAVIENFNKTVTLIQTNQKSISSGLNKIRSKLNKLIFDLDDYLESKDILDQISVLLDVISQLLSDIENALTFARLGTAHSSILKIDELESMLKIASMHYSSDQLVLPNTQNNVHRYYDLLKIEAYFSGSKIVFLVHFPIAYRNAFSYYHLYSIPNKNSTTIVPPDTYLIMNENFYQYASMPCIDLQSIYYCPEDNILDNTKKNDCIVDLLQLSPAIGKCIQTPVQVRSNIVQQIDESHYIVVFPNPSKIQTNCVRTDFTTLDGNYLIQLPFGCEFKTNDDVFTNRKDVINGQPMLLPKIKVSQSQYATGVPPIEIQDVQLDKVHKLQKEQRSIGFIIPTHSHTSIGYWTSPIYIVLILVGLCYFYKFVKRKRNPGSNAGNADSQGRAEAFFTP